MNKTQFFILRGCRDSGKTTLCTELYRQLLHYANKEHLFGKPWCNMTTVTEDSIEFDERANTINFMMNYRTHIKTTGKTVHIS